MIFQRIARPPSSPAKASGKPSGRAHRGPPKVKTSNKPTPIEGDPDPDQVRAWRRRRASQGQPFHRLKRYFNQHEDIVDGIDESTGAVFPVILAALRHRWSGTPLEGAVPAGLLGALREVSRAFVEPSQKLKLSSADLEEAFYRFARGELTLLRPADRKHPPTIGLEHAQRACQPNSTFFFFFAETADLCRRAGVDAEFWEQLLPTLVYTQRCFHEAYFDPTIAIRWEAQAPGRWPGRTTEGARIRKELAAFKARCPGGSPALARVWQRSVRASLQEP